ncbi:MAG: hypothetical protein ACLFTZ_04730 [Acholeplasmataceae bacterium]
MKRTVIKITISAVVLALSYLFITVFMVDNQAETDGTIGVEIVDQDGTTVFTDDLDYRKGDTFFDVLDRRFDLTCASRTYQPDPTCSHTFNRITHQGHVILGIEGDDFDLMTDWRHTFLAIELFDGERYVFATESVSNLPYEDHAGVRISVREAREGSS